MKTNTPRLLKGLMILALLCLTNVVKAQYYFPDYGPGSTYWYAQQVQQRQAERMQMFWQQMQLQQYYQAQRIAAEQQMNAILQSMPTGYTSSQSSENMPTYHKENVPCSQCNGGVVTRQYMNNGQVRTQTRTCSYCHGKGYRRETVQD